MKKHQFSGIFSNSGRPYFPILQQEQDAKANKDLRLSDVLLSILVAD